MAGNRLRVATPILKVGHFTRKWWTRYKVSGALSRRAFQV